MANNPVQFIKDGLLSQPSETCIFKYMSSLRYQVFVTEGLDISLTATIYETWVKLSVNFLGSGQIHPPFIIDETLFPSPKMYRQEQPLPYKFKTLKSGITHYMRPRYLYYFSIDAAIVDSFLLMEHMRINTL